MLPATAVSSEIPPQLLRPNIRLSGDLGDGMLSSFADQLDQVLGGDDPVVLELFTLGGDADVARRIALEIKLCRERQGRDVYFVGKTTVYSGGVTIMSAFPRDYRFLSRDCVLLIHERKLDQEVHFFGPLRANVLIAKDMLAQIEIGIALERDGFRELAEGSRLSTEEICQHASDGWYVTASQALDHGLVAGLL